MFTDNLLMQFSLTLTNLFIEMFLFRDDQNVTATAQRNSADFLTADVKTLLLILRVMENINNMQLHH